MLFLFLLVLIYMWTHSILSSNCFFDSVSVSMIHQSALEELLPRFNFS